MADSRQDTDELLARLKNLSLSDRHSDWGADLQDVCESVWTSLDHEHHADTATMEAFIHVLLEKDGYALAQLVIPELRGRPAGSLENKQRQLVIERTWHMRQETNTTAEAGTNHDTSLYSVEKDIFREAELYRARLVFQDRERLSEQESKDLEEWWANCPLIKRRRPAE